MTVRELADRLARLNLDAAGAEALALQAEVLADAIRAALSHPPGTSHEFPWLQTGSLRDSIQTTAEPGEALVGSTSNVALYQERGTGTVPPRPFFGPVAAAHADELATAIGKGVFQSLFLP